VSALLLALALAAGGAEPRQGALACPAGSEHGGAAPPDGFEEWCEKGVAGMPGAKRREGPARVYYDDGRPWVEESFTSGQRDGPFVEWHRNGKKAREGRFSAGAKDGRWTVFGESGRVEEESEWRLGVPEGRFVSYWPSGARRTEGRHCGGAQCGKWTTYDEAGKLLGSVDYGEQARTP
jgi:antitoxin component YwqK of YwqJK toxin-antitoxin module